MIFICFRYTCKTLDANVVSSTFKPADWKFQNNFTKWYQISCRFDLDQPSLGGHSLTPLKSQLKVAVVFRKHSFVICNFAIFFVLACFDRGQ